jgi:hypothetical protein
MTIERDPGRGAILVGAMASSALRICWPALVVLGLACGRPNQAPQAPGPSPGATDAGATDAGAPTPGARVEHPFARTVIEAQTIIQDQIDSRMKTLWKCVSAYRASTGDPHKGVIVDVGIDQEGALLGVTTPSTKQGGLEPTLRQCLWDGLHGLPFPRSHAGVITVRQTFTDATVSP